MIKGKVINCKDKSFTNRETGEAVQYFDLGVMVGNVLGFVGSRENHPVGSEITLALETSKDHKFYVTVAKPEK